jgi:hypothetical protein
MSMVLTRPSAEHGSAPPRFRKLITRPRSRHSFDREHGLDFLPVEGQRPLTVGGREDRPGRRRAAGAASQLNDHLVQVVAGQIPADELADPVAERRPQERFAGRDRTEIPDRGLELRVQDSFSASCFEHFGGGTLACCSSIEGADSFDGASPSSSEDLPRRYAPAPIPPTTSRAPSPIRSHFGMCTVTQGAT